MGYLTDSEIIAKANNQILNHTFLLVRDKIDISEFLKYTKEIIADLLQIGNEKGQSLQRFIDEQNAKKDPMLEFSESLKSESCKTLGKHISENYKQAEVASE